MNISEIFTAQQVPAAYMQPAGMVFVIRCVPDIFTSEQFNIGVCAIDNNGNRKAKVITEPGRLSCFYGESASNVVLLAQAALEAALAGVQPPSSQIIFDTPTPYYNVTIEDLVANTFADQVTAALPHRQSSEKEMIDDEKAWEKVSDAIKLAKKLDTPMLANTPQVIIQTEKGLRTLRVPLQPINGVGTIRSAYYSPSTLKTHLMDSVLDMECAARYRNKKHMGLFILRPPKASKELNKQLDAVIDGIAYRAPVTMVMDQGYSPNDLANLVTHWAEEAA